MLPNRFVITSALSPKVRLTGAMDPENSTPTPPSLDTLHDIVLAEAVSWWPLAPGWYLLITAAILISLLIVWPILSIRSRNSYRRKGLEELHEAAASGEYAKIPRLLRHVALSAYPRSSVASLSGSQWLEFLNSVAPGCIGEQEGNHLLAVAYAGKSLNSADGERLVVAAQNWILHHSPPS